MIFVSGSAPSRLAESTFFGQRWPKGFVCPRCGCREAYHQRCRDLWWCRGCGYQVSVTAGTLFHKTKAALWKWFWAIYRMSQCKKGLSAVQLMKEIDVSYPTAWLMMQRLRQAMQRREAQYRLVLYFISSVAYYLIQSYTSGCWLQANPKSEYRNSKQIRNLNDLILQTKTKSFFLFVLNFGFWSFELVSCFGF